MITELKKRLIEHEGTKPHAYKDSRGFVTVGHGTCIDEKAGCGLSKDQMLYLMRYEIAVKQKELHKLPWYPKLDLVRQDALTELAYNLGVSGVLKFVKMVAAIIRGDWVEAVNQLLDSLWATQVGQERIEDIAYRLEHGKYK